MEKQLPKTAIIRSSGFNVFACRIGGLYLLERNIRLLWHSGVTAVYLDLDEAEQKFYSERIFKRVKSLKGMTIVPFSGKAAKNEHLLIGSSDFLQYYNLLNFTGYFKKKGSLSFVPNSEIVTIKNGNQAVAAEKTALEHIRLSAGGFFARTINKRISLPISRFLSKLNIHPNVLTFLNFGIMIFGGSLLWTGGHVSQIVSGAIFQFVSIFDGCDGEVAKLNCRFSRIGSIFDTVNDYTCLLFYFSGISYVYYKTIGSGSLIIVAAIGFAGILVMMGAIIAYLVKFSNTGSFVAYNREFMDKLPKSDPVVRFIDCMQYLTRKEFYSWVAFLVSIPGAIYLMVPYVAVSTSVGGILLLILDIRYFPKLPQVRKNTAMTYISRRS
jgi:phosphatidylglycerophosphate synthase